MKRKNSLFILNGAFCIFNFILKLLSAVIYHLYVAILNWIEIKLQSKKIEITESELKYN